MKSKLNLAFMALAALSCFKSNAQTDKSLSNLTAPTAINQSLLPNANNANDLGSSTLGWKDIYISNRMYLNGRLTIHASGSTSNFFAGNDAGNTSITGSYNTGIGKYSLSPVTTGSSNTAIGAYTLYSNKTASNNTAVGSETLRFNSTGYTNTGVGSNALHYNTTGSSNDAFGANALNKNTTGSVNTAIGSYALELNTTGVANVATGSDALHGNQTGSYNTANGENALSLNNSGSYNTAVGNFTLYYNKDGKYNTAVGYAAGFVSQNTSLTNTTALGYGASAFQDNQVRIGNGNVTSIGGQVGWTTFSDGRYKRNMKENVSGLAFINSLRPVTYNVDTKSLSEHFNKGRKQTQEKTDVKAKAEIDKATDEAGKIVQDGFVAQEVEEAAKKLGIEFSGIDKPKTEDGLYGLRYDKFVVPLVKAVQELSKMNDEKNAKINALRKEVDELKNIVLKGNQKSLSSQPSISTSLTDASLEQNTPNPFSNSTTIHYTLPQKFTTAQIVITDNTNKTLKQVNISGEGKGTLNVDASTLSSGAYNYSLIIDGKIIGTKQMEHLK